MKFVVDMNLSPRWIPFLREAGFEAEHWSAIGRSNASDSEVMTYAALHNCIVLTHDLDFSSILAATHGKKPSVVQLRIEDMSLSATGNRLVQILKLMERELEAGAVLTIGPGRIRIRMLPLAPGR